LLAADVEELTYDASAEASGFVLEAKRDPKRGIEATVIVKNGTFSHRGDAINTHSASGKVKILEDFWANVSRLSRPRPRLSLVLKRSRKLARNLRWRERTGRRRT
jgi:translation initiation factor IF-2